MVTVGVIGYGYWGPNLVRNFAQMPQSNLAAVCDLSPDNLKKVKNLFSEVAVTQEYDDLLNNPEIDAIVIAASAPIHYDLAKRALDANKHILVEKPLTLSSETSRDLIDRAEKANRILMVGHLLEYHSAVEHMKGLVESGTLGDVLYLYSQRLNLGQVRKDENALWSLAPHDFSIIFYLLGGKDPVEVTAVGQSYLTEGVEDVVFCSVKFKDKTMAHIHVSWLDPHKARKITVVGNKKMAVFDDMESSEKIRIYDKGVGSGEDYKTYGEDLTLRFGDITIPTVKLKEPLRAECEHFVECIETGRTPRSDGYNGLRVVKALEAAHTSLKNGGQLVRISEA